MSIHWDTRNRRWRFQFDRWVAGRRHRASRLLPQGWNQAQADAYDRKESGRLYAVASGVERLDPLIDDAVVAYLRDKQALKSIKSAAENLAAITWAYTGRPMSELADVARAVSTCDMGWAPATIRQRLALLKAACRWAWKARGMVDADPTTRMQLPTVRNERHVYIDRLQMLQVARQCTNAQARAAIRMAFYSGLRLSELLRAEVIDGVIVLEDTKNGDRRAIPAHPRIRHLLPWLPLSVQKRTLQAAWMRACERAGLVGVHFHDLRHSAASAMVNAGVPLYDVGAVLGHRDPRSTGRYAHLTAGRLGAAIGAIGRKSPHTAAVEAKKKAPG